MRRVSAFNNTYPLDIAPYLVPANWAIDPATLLSNDTQLTGTGDLAMLSFLINTYHNCPQSQGCFVQSRYGGYNFRALCVAARLRASLAASASWLDARRAPQEQHRVGLHSVHQHHRRLWHAPLRTALALLMSLC